MRSGKRSSAGNNSKKIFLIGFMGCGKSTVGPLLAERLGLPFVDLDERIEASDGRPIARVFEENGEGYFRDLETRCLEDLVHEKASVVALGGGCMMLGRNRELIRRQGVSVYLACPVELLCERLVDDGSRPVLRRAPGSDLRSKVASLLAQRESYYRQADWIVDQNEGESVEEIVGRILKRLRKCR